MSLTKDLHIYIKKRLCFNYNQLSVTTTTISVHCGKINEWRRLAEVSTSLSGSRHGKWRARDAMFHWRRRQVVLMNQEKEYLLLAVLCFSACHVCVAKEKMHVSSQTHTHLRKHDVTSCNKRWAHTCISWKNLQPPAPLDSMWMTTLPHFVIIACVHTQLTCRLCVVSSVPLICIFLSDTHAHTRPMFTSLYQGW